MELDLSEITVDRTEAEEQIIADIKARKYKFIESIPADLELTEEVCMASVKFNSIFLKWIPESLRTRNIVMTAILNDSNAIRLIPAASHTEEMCYLAVKHNSRVLKFCEIQTPEICQMAIEEDGIDALGSIRPENVTEDIIRTALKNDQNALMYVNFEPSEDFSVELRLTYPDIDLNEIGSRLN